MLRKERDRGPAFSSKGYLRSNPDVRRAAFNPLLHYVLHGFAEGRSSTNGHAGWIEQSEMLDDLDRVAIRQHIAGLTRHPVISVVVPVYNPNPHHLSEMIASVTKQAYPYWELCIADDSSDDPNVSRVLHSTPTPRGRTSTCTRGNSRRRAFS